MDNSTRNKQKGPLNTREVCNWRVSKANESLVCTKLSFQLYIHVYMYVCDKNNWYINEKRKIWLSKDGKGSDNKVFRQHSQ